MIYVFGTICSMFFSYIAVNLYRRRNYYRENGITTPIIWSRIFCFLSVLPLTIISAVRYGVGTDFYSYSKIYRNIDSSNVEVGFKLFVNILRKVSEDPQIFFVVTSIMVCVLYFVMIYKESESPVYSILLFVLTRDYFRSMNGVRQYMAIVVVLLSLPYVKRKEWKKVAIFVLIAASFHISALVFVVFYIFGQYKIQMKQIVITIAATFLFAGTIRNIILPILTRYTEYGKYFDSSSYYANSEFEGTVFMIYVAFFLLLAYVRVVEKVPMDTDLNMLQTGIFIGLFFYSLGIAFPNNIGRMGWYANSLIAIYAPALLNRVPKKWMRDGLKIAIVICYMYITIPQLLKGNQTVLPYKTFWNY